MTDPKRHFDPHERLEEPPLWKELARRWLGRVCVPFLSPAYVTKFVEDFYIDQEPKGVLKQAIRTELTRRFAQRSDAQRRADNRNRFWGSTAGIKWHEERLQWYQDPQQFQDSYLKSRGELLRQIDWLVHQDAGIKTLCEIGTGNGLFVDHLSSNLNQIENFHGIDLNAAQISRNREMYGDSKVEFFHIEVNDYVQRHCQPGALFVACGTFECFTQLELEELFASVREKVPHVAFAMCDAVDIDYDAETERDSRHKDHLLYNHNYRHLLEKHGYQICFYDRARPKPIYDRVTMLATSFPCGQINHHTQTTR